MLFQAIIISRLLRSISFNCRLQSDSIGLMYQADIKARIHGSTPRHVIFLIQLQGVVCDI